MPEPPPPLPAPWAHGGQWDPCARRKGVPIVDTELPVDPQHTSPIRTKRGLLTTRNGASFAYHDRNSGPLSGQRRPFRSNGPLWLKPLTHPAPWPSYESDKTPHPSARKPRSGKEGISHWAVPPPTVDGLPLDPIKSGRAQTAPVGIVRGTRHGAARRYQQSQVGIVVFGAPVGHGPSSTHAAAGVLHLPRAFGLLPSSVHTYETSAEDLHRLSRSGWC